MRARVASHHPRTTFHTASKKVFSEVRSFEELRKSYELLERANLEGEGVPNTRCQHREGAGDKEVNQPVARVCLRGGPPSPHRAEPTVHCEVDRDCQREEQRCRL